MRVFKTPILLLVIALFITACTDQDLVTVSKALNDTAQSLTVLQTTVIAANTQHLLSDASTRQILLAATRVNEAGQQAVAITRNLNTLAPADRTTLLGILRPVIAALADTQTSVVGKIPDAKTQMTIQSTIGLIQASLNTAQLALAAKGQ